MISKEDLMQVLIKGRYECYISKSSDYNPYKKSVLYDWEFKTETNGFVFTDSYRGFNPYSGVESVYPVGNDIPIWSCDYIGYVVPDTEIFADKVYEFLKEARGAHLLNCNGNLFSDYKYDNEVFQYKTHFQGDVNAILQVENFYYGDNLVAQQMTAGRLKL
jgi:hypothetical protein